MFTKRKQYKFKFNKFFQNLPRQPYFDIVANDIVANDIVATLF